MHLQLGNLIISLTPLPGGGRGSRKGGEREEEGGGGGRVLVEKGVAGKPA